MSVRKISVGALLLLAGASVALACGPFFPWQLLDDRRVTLKSTPSNSFGFEAAHLVTAGSDRLRAVESDPYATDADRADAFRRAEALGLSPADAAHIATMRAATDADAADAAGAGLPDAVRLYVSGAVAFTHQDLAGAAKRFAAVLSLPESQRRSRVVWAAYMLAKTSAAQGDAAKAGAEFAETRRLAQAGDPDPLGLAVASFGEEARLAFRRANLMLQSQGTATPPAGTAHLDYAGFALPAAQAAAWRDAIADAVNLYAEQAAHSSDVGVQSLRIIAENVLASPDRVAAAVRAPLVQRLLVIYALARLDDSNITDGGTNDAGTRIAGVTLNPLLPKLVNAIIASGVTAVPGADRLAALAYRTARYDLAGQMAARASGPLAEWVKAKIALQRGDLGDAAAHYALASRGFPAKGAVLDADNANRVAGESGVVELARGDYRESLEILYPLAKTYWGDVAYIAERVLTVDELRRFVDAHVPAPKADAPAPTAYGDAPADPNLQLRNLLARRLMREGRYAAAFGYFTDAKQRAQAQDYAAALHEAQTDWIAVNRARGFYDAAMLARESGMEILGSEGAPDFFALSGLYPWGVGQDKPSGAFVTQDEAARAAASAARPDIRYHYRYIAVDEANAAGDALPRRSQAFAAVLCEAEGWMMETPGETARVRAIWHRYVVQGPRVSFAKHFGRNCPAPDFRSAETLEWHLRYLATRHYISHHRWWFAGGAVLGLGLLAAGFAMSRRRRNS